jgi:hypothetical protein
MKSHAVRDLRGSSAVWFIRRANGQTSEASVADDETSNSYIDRGGKLKLFLVLFSADLACPAAGGDFSLGRHHRVRFADQVLQLWRRENRESFERHPFVAACVRSRADSLLFGEFGKLFWSAFERKPLRDRTQIHYGEDLASHFETEVFSPLQILRCIWEGKAEVTDGFQVHD